MSGEWVLAVGVSCCLLCGISLQICSVCFSGQRRKGGAGAVAGTGGEGTDLALGLVLELGIGTRENPDTGQGAELEVQVGTVKIETDTLRGAMRDGETNTLTVPHLRSLPLEKSTMAKSQV